MSKRMLMPLAAAVLAIPVLSGCDRGKGQAAPSPAQAAPVPEVVVYTVQPQRVVLTTELPGRTAGYLVSEIRPQVNGLIQKRLFVEGADVKAGETLYEIDPAPLQAAYEQATASLEAAQKAAIRARSAVDASLADVAKQQATLTFAQTNRQRYEDLIKDKAVAASERDQAVTAAEVAQAGLKAAEAQVESNRSAVAAADAAVKQAEAAVQSAKINLGYTKIAAPISGRIGRSSVTEGAIVTAYQPMALATIQQMDPIYVDVPQSTVELNRLRRSLEEGKLQRTGAEMDKVRLVMEGGHEYPEKGKLQFRDISVDPTTGSVILRIVVPNPRGVLLPGMFVRAVVEEGANDQAILAPQQAVTRDPRGNASVLTVDADGKVVQRAIVTERAIGDMWLVSSGLAAGDRIIIEGLQKARPGATVKIATAPQNAAGTAGTTGAGKTEAEPGSAAKSN